MESGEVNAMMENTMKTLAIYNKIVGEAVIRFY